MTNRIPIMGEPGPYDPCPCDSSCKAKFCCRTSNGWFKKHAKLPTSVPTGEAVTGCFAGTLQDCQGVLSKEHVVPRALLESGGRRAVEASGISWLKGETRTIATSKLWAQVSCERHNNIAIPFDTEITRLYRTFSSFSATSWTTDDHAFKVFSGPDLERGLVKILLCAGAAGWIVGAAGPVVLPAGHPRLLDFLYGTAGSAEIPGFHLLRLRQPHAAASKLELQLLYDSNNKLALVALLLVMAGFAMAYFLVPTPTVGLQRSPYAETWRRPTRLTLYHGECRKTLMFSWPSDYGTDNSEIMASAFLKSDTGNSFPSPLAWA